MAPNLLKHRILLGLLYDGGLRCITARRLRISDLDLNRKMIHVRQGKGRRDRYVPTGSVLTAVIRDYLKIYQPVKWLLNGNVARKCSQRGIQLAMSKAVKQA